MKKTMIAILAALMIANAASAASVYADEPETPAEIIQEAAETAAEPEAPAAEPEAPAAEPEAPAAEPEAPAAEPEVPAAEPEAPAAEPEAPAAEPEAPAVEPETPEAEAENAEPAETVPTVDVEPAEELSLEAMLKAGTKVYVFTRYETTELWQQSDLTGKSGTIVGAGSNLLATEYVEWIHSVKVYAAVNGVPMIGYIALDTLNPDVFTTEDPMDGKITLDGRSLYEISYVPYVDESAAEAEPNPEPVKPALAVELTVGLPEGVDTLYYGDPMIFTANVSGAASGEVVFSWLYSEDAGENWTLLENENGSMLSLISTPEVDNWRITVHVEMICEAQNSAEMSE